VTEDSKCANNRAISAPTLEERNPVENPFSTKLNGVFFIFQNCAFLWRTLRDFPAREIFFSEKNKSKGWRLEHRYCKNGFLRHACQIVVSSLD